MVFIYIYIHIYIYIYVFYVMTCFCFCSDGFHTNVDLPDLWDVFSALTCKPQLCALSKLSQGGWWWCNPRHKGSVSGDEGTPSSDAIKLHICGLVDSQGVTFIYNSRKEAGDFLKLKRCIHSHNWRADFVGDTQCSAKQQLADYMMWPLNGLKKLWPFS